MMPATHSMRLAVRPSRSALMIGMPPATAASKATITPRSRAAAKISLPCTASRALLAVTTCLPSAIASSTSVRAMPVPPISSTTISMAGLAITWRASATTSAASPTMALARAVSRSATIAIRMPRPARRRISCWLRASTWKVPEPTVPMPSRPTWIGVIAVLAFAGVFTSDAVCGSGRGSGRCGRSPRSGHRSWAGRRCGSARCRAR